MESFKITFSGKTLDRGFWIYVVRIANPKKQRYFYVGMTGDPSSFNAASLFVRMGRHLDVKKNAKGNTLFRAIKNEEKLLPFLHKLNFEIIGFYLKEENKKDHKKIREEASHLEDRLHKDLEAEGYAVLGSKWAKQKPDIPNHWKKKYLEIKRSTLKMAGDTK